MQTFDKVGVFAVEEGGGKTGVTGTTGSTNSMDVIIDIAWQVVVDNVGDVWNI